MSDRVVHDHSDGCPICSCWRMTSTHPVRVRAQQPCATLMTSSATLYIFNNDSWHPLILKQLLIFEIASTLKNFDTYVHFYLPEFPTASSVKLTFKSASHQHPPTPWAAVRPSPRLPWPPPARSKLPSHQAGKQAHPQQGNHISSTITPTRPHFATLVSLMKKEATCLMAGS